MTRISRTRRPALLLAAMTLTGSATRAHAQQTSPNAPPITLQVDATDAARNLFHARLSLPVKPGPLTLLYPKWIPGEHGPTGPIINLVGLKLSANGQPVPWRRDDVEMYALKCVVPPGASTLDIALDFLSPSDTNGFSGSASATPQLAVLSWNQMLLYPQGKASNDLTFAARLRLPAGWKYGTALPVESESSEGITFRPVSLTTLVDSPVLSGANLKSVPVTPGETPLHQIILAADSQAALDTPSDFAPGYRRLVGEANALFGAQHYTGYRWLLTLSDHVSSFGLEHHESSDDRVSENTLGSEAGRRGLAGLLAHEYVHSWNGKYRRPKGLATSDYSQPMAGELLWVYEGLTEYLGTILPARAGLWSAETLRENLAATAALMDNTPGRTWRPLADTAIAAQLLYTAPAAWGAYRRGTDFYAEGTLLWLDADVTLRRLSDGKRSLNDFCRRFHGGQSGPPALKPYSFEDVVATMNEVLPTYDWKAFFTQRLNSTDAHAPLNGITDGGWRLVYTDKPNESIGDAEGVNHFLNAIFSLGMTVGSDNLAISDVVPGTLADKAGLSPGMKIIAVNGRKANLDRLRAAIKASRAATDPLELVIENGEYYKTVRIDYHDGERYPHLERDAAKPDVLSEVIKPLTPGGAAGAASASGAGTPAPGATSATPAKP